MASEAKDGKMNAKQRKCIQSTRDRAAELGDTIEDPIIENGHVFLKGTVGDEPVMWEIWPDGWAEILL